MDDLWNDASQDHDAFARQAALAQAEAGLDTIMPFLLAARSQREFEHRVGYARESIVSIAEACGIDADDLAATAARRYQLYREALAEGQDPTETMVGATHTYGTGPEQDYGHQEGPDFSHGYSEVPQGPEGGPDPQVTQVRPPMAGPVQEATGSLRRQAGMTTAPYTAPQQPDTGTSPQVQTAVPSAGGMSPTLPAGMSGNGDDTVPLTPSSIGQVTSSSDPVRRRVMAVTAAIRETNPQLPAAECERVARHVVGRYLVRADMTSSVMDDQPGGSSGSSSDSSGGGGGGAVQHMLEGQGLRGMIPGMGGGGGGGAAGAAGELGEIAEVAAL